MTTDVTVRRALETDLEEMGKLAGALVRFHHAIDAKRFFLVEGVDRGYARFFAGELEDTAAVLLVATRAGALLGYAYARAESRDWNLLLDAHGALHDIFVLPEARRAGVASLLLEAVVKELGALGAPRVVLSTAVQNAAAQAFFARAGFRPTMLEMTREL